MANPPSSVPLAPPAPAKQPPKRHTFNPVVTKRKKDNSKSFLPTLLTSAAAVLIILFALGDLPQIDALWTSLNTKLQAHNDDAVRLFIRLGPALLFAFGLIGLTLMLNGAVRRRRKSA